MASNAMGPWLDLPVNRTEGGIRRIREVALLDKPSSRVRVRVRLPCNTSTLRGQILQLGKIEESNRVGWLASFAA